MSSSEVRAAGGIVMRESAEGPELLLIHRPKYDDWSFPKGKLDSGESFRTAAHREVLEETGLSCELGRRLPTVLYRDHKGRPKEVRYWLMEVLEGDIAERPADQEVDQCRWLPPDRAREKLTYEHDRELTDEAMRIYLDGNT